MRVRARPFTRGELARPALVVAPHPDDETLACGGLIARKRAAGAEVHVALLTDGEASHAGADPEELRRRRRAEALAACRELGVPDGAVTFLEYPDGGVEAAARDAAACLLALVQRHQPAEVYAPYARDRHPDHEAAYRIARSALRYGRPVTLYEYPVWGWQHWPWVALRSPLRLRGRRTIAGGGSGWRASLAARFGLRLLTEFGRAADIRPVREQKRRALGRYESQLVPPPDRPDWPTLGGVDGGDFLACFLRDFELFRHSVPATVAAS